ncbi:MAG: co-chaperone GroES [Parcubacteria group bacterium]
MKKKNIQTKSAKVQIKPFGDRVLVRPFTEDEVKGGQKNHYGIIIPDTVSKEKSAQGKILAVGEGKLIDGKLVPIRLKVGDIVVFSKYGYDEVEQGGEELYLLKEESILAVIK